MDTRSEPSESTYLELSSKADLFIQNEISAIQQTDLEQLRQNDVYNVIGLKSDSVIFWTSNNYLPDSAALYAHNSRIEERKSGWYLIVPIQSKQVIITRPLLHKEYGYFKSQNFIPDLRNISYRFNKSGDYKILNGQYAIDFFETKNQKDAQTTWILVILYLALLLSSIINQNQGKYLGISVLIALGARLHHFVFKESFAFYFTELFDPLIFASSKLVPSLGDLLLHVLVAGILVILSNHFYRKVRSLENWLSQVALGVAILVLFFMADLIRGVLSSLIANSNISFDISHIQSIDLYSLLAISIVGVMFWLLYVFGSAILRVDFVGKWQLALYSFASGVLFIVFQHYDASRSFESLIPVSSFVICFILLNKLLHHENTNGHIYRYVSYILLFSLFTGSVIKVGLHKKEREFLDFYASKLISNKDLQAEFLFKDMENELAQLFIEPKNFKDLESDKETYERRLKRLYFSGYLDKYDMLVINFDSIGNNVNSSPLYSQMDLDSMYNFMSFPTLSNHFYQVKSDQIFNGYLAKFENCDLNGHYGSVFILLVPKLIQSYTDDFHVLSDKREMKQFDVFQYSYGLYARNTLINQRGKYPYALEYHQEDFSKNKGFLKSFDHIISSQEDATVVFSKPIDGFQSYVSTYSFALLYYLLASTIVGFLLLVLMFCAERVMERFGLMGYETFRKLRLGVLSRIGTDQIYLSTRIRLSMVFIVLTGLIVSVYVTIQFIQTNNQILAEDALIVNIREVANQMQNEVDFSKKLQNTEERQLIINEFGDFFKTDLNLFNQNGHLIASSVAHIYDDGLFAPLMHPNALRAFEQDNLSQFIQNENVRDLEFTSAYVPLVNNTRRVIAYLNLPYFSRQEDINKQIGSYAVTLVNIYLVIILLAIALAYIISQRITKPLQLIRDKLSNTDIETNELLEWKSNDEIGRLIKQYNKMVLQLGESAQKLSESEREGAWKEMARQVAHEIKNPLTPMKLNIQHLQRAWADKNERLEDTFKRVTGVLIEQIDSLSKLATEFSSFAQLPQDNFEQVDLSEVLKNTITLFERSEQAEFVYTTPFSNATIMADKEQLKRVFTNVIKNAIQAIPEGRKGIIQIQLKTADSRVIVSISDNGKGIEPKIQDKIFVPNFSTKTSGMGLGLAMTKKMVEAAGGDITFTTATNEGTTFKLSWPLVK